MTLFIGLDGGGTGCRARAARADGSFGACVTGGPANVHSDLPGAVAEIGRVLARVLRAEGVTDPTHPGLRVVLGLAGATETGAAAHLARALPYPNLTVLGDIDIALRGAFQDRDGIVMAVGTGSVLARQTQGQMHRIGGYGFALGDEGSGAWLGRRAMSATLHARDGLTPEAPLTHAVWSKFKTVAAMLDFTTSASPADYAALAPRIMALDDDGCPLARAILDEGCAYLLGAIRQLQADAAQMPVAALGGLGPALLGRIAATATPALTITPPMGTALDGAVWLARHLSPHESMTE